MSILQIELPDEQLQIISEQARASGFEDNGQYLLSLVQKLIEQPRANGNDPTAEQLEREERLLLQAADSPRTQATPELWSRLRAELGENA